MERRLYSSIASSENRSHSLRLRPDTGPIKPQYGTRGGWTSKHYNNEGVLKLQAQANRFRRSRRRELILLTSLSTSSLL